MLVSRVDETDKVRDTVQIENPLKMQNNSGGMRSPMTMNFRTAQKVNPLQNAANEAGVVISISNNRANNLSQANNSLSNIDMNLFSAD